MTTRIDPMQPTVPFRYVWMSLYRERLTPQQRTELQRAKLDG